MDSPSKVAAENRLRRAGKAVQQETGESHPPIITKAKYEAAVRRLDAKIQRYTDEVDD